MSFLVRKFSQYYSLYDYLIISNSDPKDFIKDCEYFKNNFRDFYENIGKLEFEDKRRLSLKILGDIFESMIGAIYYDSGYNYEATR